MKLIDIKQDKKNWNYEEYETLAEWAEENIDKGDYLFIAHDNIAMFEQDIVKYGLKYVNDLKFSIFENNGAHTFWSIKLKED